MSAPLHFRSIYYLPSWQGGDRVLPRCGYSGLGWTTRSGKLTRKIEKVTCSHCRRQMGLPALAPRPKKRIRTWRASIRSYEESRGQST